MTYTVWFAAALTFTTTIAVTWAPRAQQPSRPIATVYKSPSCGCCNKWIDHLRVEGFDVKVLDVDDVEAVKSAYVVPPELASCHTALVGRYAIEGHVPADAIKRLIRERPQIAGLAVPGMPVGSPGMEQPGRREPYAIVSFDRSGRSAVYDRR